MDHPDILLSYDERIPEEEFDEFISLIASDKISFIKEPRPHGTFAGVEWLLPTAVIIFISKSYFDSFLKEMGKDHYHYLKKGILALRKKFFGENPEIKFHHIGSPSTKLSDSPYSLTFSIMSNTKDGRSLKFLISENSSPDIYRESIESFLESLAEHHTSAEEDSLSIQIQGLSNMPRTILVRYNEKAKKAEIFDPLDEIRKKKER